MCCIPPRLQPLYITLTLSRAGCRALQLYSIQLNSSLQFTTSTSPLWRPREAMPLCVGTGYAGHVLTFRACRQTAPNKCSAAISVHPELCRRRTPSRWVRSPLYPRPLRPASCLTPAPPHAPRRQSFSRPQRPATRRRQRPSWQEAPTSTLPTRCGLAGEGERQSERESGCRCVCGGGAGRSVITWRIRACMEALVHPSPGICARRVCLAGRRTRGHLGS